MNKTNVKPACPVAIEAAALFGKGKSYNEIARQLKLRDKTEARNKVAEGQRGHR